VGNFRTGMEGRKLAPPVLELHHWDLIMTYRKTEEV
jgi:hypothetical protein